MKVEIDPKSGFCFGVTRAISMAEDELDNGKRLFCLGDIVHNNAECERLNVLGLRTVNHEEFLDLRDARVLLRAHGEPPSTYRAAEERCLHLVDATCPVVLQLQRRIRRQYVEHPEAQIIIFGKPGHAEVLGLVGQTEGKAVVVENIVDLDRVDYSRDIYLYSQTTKDTDEYKEVIRIISERLQSGTQFHWFDTICRQVSNRTGYIAEFAGRHNLILFVSGSKSSNGSVLFEVCKRVNVNSHLIASASDICPSWLTGVDSVGICGATSTPQWLMEACRDEVIRQTDLSTKEHH